MYGDSAKNFVATRFYLLYLFLLFTKNRWVTMQKIQILENFEKMRTRKVES
jgi:hypothetical protein